MAGACLSASKKISLQSENLIFKIQWKYSSPLAGGRGSFLSIVSAQRDKKLRLDILQPFIGVIGSLILKDQKMLLLAPLRKQYYEGDFNSEMFFPHFPSFAGSELIALLRARAPENCERTEPNQNLLQCPAESLEIEWKYKRGRLNKIYIRNLKKRGQISAHIKSLSSKKKLASKIFNPSLKGWARQKDALFFQKL